MERCVGCNSHPHRGVLASPTKYYWYERMIQMNALKLLDVIMEECNNVFEEVGKRGYMDGKYTAYRFALTKCITDAYLEARDLAACIVDAPGAMAWYLAEKNKTVRPVREFEFGAYELVFRNEFGDEYRLVCCVEVFCSALVWHTACEF